MTSFERATPVLKTADYPASKAFYIGRLGFEVVEEGGDPPRFGIFRGGPAFVFVDSWKGPPIPTAGGWDVYFHVTDVDAIAAELRQRDVEIVREPTVTVYGMKELEVLDHGNRLCFGSDA